MKYIIKTTMYSARGVNVAWPCYVGRGDVHNSKVMADVFASKEEAHAAAKSYLSTGHAYEIIPAPAGM